MGKLITTWKNGKNPNKISLKESIHLTKSKRLKNWLAVSVVINLLSISYLILTTIR